MRSLLRGRRLAGNVVFAAGVLLIAAALILTMHNVLEDRRAGNAARTIRNELAASINSGTAVSQKVYVAPKPDPENEGSPVNQTVPESGFEVDPDMPYSFLPMEVCSLGGDLYIGILDVPDYGLSLPVIDNWSYEKLKTAPCRYSGSYKTDDLVICAHNYSHHFGPLRDAPEGTEVILTTVDQEVYRYRVAQVETLEPHEVGYLTDVLADWDLTLFTCTPGGNQRKAVRCEKAE
ncbi:MAG: sortase [Firmicutes bacterium]|nr:sortase [Bacillota bacterium]